MFCLNALLVVLCCLLVFNESTDRVGSAKTSDYKSMDHFCRSLRQSELLAAGGQHKICLLFLTDWLATWHEAKDTCLLIQDLFGAPEPSRLAIIRDEHQFKLAVQRFMEQHRVNMEFWVGAQQSNDSGVLFWHTSNNQTVQFNTQCEAGNKPNTIYSNPNSIYSNPNSIYSNQSCVHTNAIQPINTLQLDNCTQQKAFICEFASDQIEREDITCSGWGNLQYFCDSFHGSHYDSQNDVCLLFSRHSANFSEARRNCEKVFPEIFQAPTKGRLALIRDETSFFAALKEKNAIDRWIGAKSDESGVWKWIMDEPKNDYCGILAAKENKCARSVPDGNGGLKMGETDCEEIKEFVCEFSNEPTATDISCKAECPNIDHKIAHNLQVVYEHHEPFPSFTSLTLKCVDLWVAKDLEPETKECEDGIWEELPATAKHICYEPCTAPLSQHLQPVGGGVFHAVRHNEMLKVTGKCDHPWISKDVELETKCDDGAWTNKVAKNAVCYEPCATNPISQAHLQVAGNGLFQTVGHNQVLKVTGKCDHPWISKNVVFEAKCDDGSWIWNSPVKNAVCHAPCQVPSSPIYKDQHGNILTGPVPFGTDVFLDQDKCSGVQNQQQVFKCSSRAAFAPSLDDSNEPCFAAQNANLQLGGSPLIYKVRGDRTVRPNDKQRTIIRKIANENIKIKISQIDFEKIGRAHV